jgi:hypothetical protein
VITTAEFLRIVAALIAAVAALSFLRALMRSRRAQRAAYYSIRREAQRTANRQLSTSLTLFVIAAGLGIISAIMPPDRNAPASAPAAFPSHTPTIGINAPDSPSAQPTVYIVPTNTPARVTTLPNITATAPPTPARAIIATPTITPALTQRHMTLRAISSAIDASGAPISATTEFSKGVRAIYVVFDYRDVPTDLLMRHTWFRNGGSVYFDSASWTQSGTGSAHVAWTPPGGFEPGLYEVRVLLGNIKQFSANFMVR